MRYIIIKNKRGIIMYIGIVILGIFLVLIGAGLMQRLLEKWQIQESTAFLVTLLMLGGVLIAPVNIADVFIFSIGGFLIPFIICIAFLVRAKSYEVARTIGAFLVIGVISAILAFNFPLEGEAAIIGTGIFMGLIAGGLAFLISRSRRGAFVSAALGVMLTNVFIFLYMLILGIFIPVVVGTGNQFTAIIIAAITAVFVTEVAGEILEYREHGETDVEFLNIDKYVNKA